MSESNEYKVTECTRLWHLTPTGWLPGTYCDPDGQESIVDTPKDCVQTIRLRIVGAPMFGSKTTQAIIFEKNRKKKVIASLILQFGPAPERLFA